MANRDASEDLARSMLGDNSNSDRPARSSRGGGGGNNYRNPRVGEQRKKQFIHFTKKTKNLIFLSLGVVSVCLVTLFVMLSPELRTNGTVQAVLAVPLLFIFMTGWAVSSTSAEDSFD